MIATAEIISPNPAMMVPFGLLLACIALLPLWVGDWWAKNYPKVAYALGAVTLAYYLFGLHAWTRVLHVGHEYVSFIALIGSLYVVSGGIHISVKGEATPFANTIFLLIGALISNVLGTTGASMLLIRPWLRMNKYRVTAHHVVFFIFIVSNVGGCLTPVGDPPLFLGYLRGIPFWWVGEHCWPLWAVALGMLLVMFYAVDMVNYRRAPKSVRDAVAEPADHWRFEGLWNLVLLAVLLGAVFIDKPVMLREGLMLGAALASYFLTPKRVHDANRFNLHPIQEVAILFIGIFATMMPALDWLELHARQLGQPSASLYFWGSGMLSSMLDNAPTYLSFLAATMGSLVSPEAVDQLRHLVETHGADAAALSASSVEGVKGAVAVLQQHFGTALANGTLDDEHLRVAVLLGNPLWNKFIVAISTGAVFFGANTYIGNGPNFMVKAIADQRKVHTPSFLGYIWRFTIPFMLPMLFVVWFLFLRG